jgi:hypothetical protein
LEEQGILEMIVFTSIPMDPFSKSAIHTGSIPNPTSDEENNQSIIFHHDASTIEPSRAAGE